MTIKIIMSLNSTINFSPPKPGVPLQVAQKIKQSFIIWCYINENIAKNTPIFAKVYLF